MSAKLSIREERNAYRQRAHVPGPRSKPKTAPLPKAAKPVVEKVEKVAKAAPKASKKAAKSK